MTAYLEHANVTVPNIDDTIKFLLTMEPAFAVRHDETPAGGYCHVGSATSYVALEEPHDSTGDASAFRRPYKDWGVNHLAFVLQDVDAACARLEAAGFKRNTFTPESSPFRKRVYFYDNSGFEYELVQYLTESAAQRNAY